MRFNCSLTRRRLYGENQVLLQLVLRDLLVRMEQLDQAGDGVPDGFLVAAVEGGA